MPILRLDKYLADAGIGTRSEIKHYIKQGVVLINGQKATRPDIKINPASEHITFKNQPIHIEEFEYYILNKPSGYVSAVKDNTAPTVLSLIDSHRTGLFPVGRLDKDTEGLMLITNNGQLSHYLLSPKYHVDKTYYAIVEGNVTQANILSFKQGLYIGDEDLQIALPAKLSIVKPYQAATNQSFVEITICEGKFHQVKRMFHAIGKNVQYLKRLQMGSLKLPDDLPTGASRPLTAEEKNLLLQSIPSTLPI